jgi:hypothetical protein
MALEKPAHFVFRGAERQIPYIDRRHSNSHSASGAEICLPESWRSGTAVFNYRSGTGARIGETRELSTKACALDRAPIKLSWLLGEKPRRKNSLERPLEA